MGLILEGDYSQLEFRVAGFLAKDSQAYLDVRRVQMFTAILQVLSDAADKKQRHIPSNLYTAVSPEQTSQQRYYRAFKEKYEGVTLWHDKLQREAVKTKQITLPSGRQYAFPLRGGQSGVRPQIVQQYVTTLCRDLLPLTCFLLLLFA